MIRSACIAALVIAACARTPYPTPPARTLPSTDLPPAVVRDKGDEARVRALERECRARLSGETAEAAILALDRVREVLGSGCDIETVEHDPLHWRLRCRSDALFESGEYRLARAEAPCPELKGARTDPWTCTGAVLRGLVRPEGAGALATLQLAVMGHVDYQLLKPGSASHVCTELQTALGFAPHGRWEKVREDAPDEERLYANHQLAWCRAANVAEHVREAMTASEKTSPAAATGSAAAPSDGTATVASAPPAVEIAVLGMGTSWLASQKDGACPSHGKSRRERPDCPDARRVDVLVRFSPRVEAKRSTCAKREPGAEAALWCLEDCMEQLALGDSAGSGVQPEAAPLFVDGKEERDALPVGWYLQRVPATEGRRLALGRVCDVFDIHDPQCKE